MWTSWSWHSTTTAATPATASEPMNGTNWRVDQLTPQNAVPLVLDADEVLADHLRSPNGDAETGYVEGLIRAAQAEAQEATKLAIGRQAFAFVSDEGLTGDIWLPYPPVLSVDAVEYTAADGTVTPWEGSPLPYEVSLPAGRKPRMARLRPTGGASWPSLSTTGFEGLRVAYTAGYTAETLPASIKHGMLLVIGELYKQRSESVHTTQTPALLRARSLWSRIRVY